MSSESEIARRRTFAIISHPDAGKTTLTEKLLLFGGAIQMAGTIRSRKASRHATSDWMELEKQRGISVTTSVMQFPYRGCVMNLLDTPGHADFSEDTYRTLTAVDSALMVIDAAKGVEERTIRLLEVCRLRNTPIITFINKLDRDSQDPLDLLDEIERILGIRCAPVTWPIGQGRLFRGVYDLPADQVSLYEPHLHAVTQESRKIPGLDDAALGAELEEDVIRSLRSEVELVRGASHAFDRQAFLEGSLSPVYFGSALNNFGVRELLDAFVDQSPCPQPRETTTREVQPLEKTFSGFVFKIQANMDPGHRDRVAFMRICSGRYFEGMKLWQVSQGREVKISRAMTFMASEREQLVEAWPGDIMGIYNHGTIQIGDTFTEGETLAFTGIPCFAPSLFRGVRLKDPLRFKALQKGLQQLSEEGATQLFRPLNSNALILGAVGVLQFDVVAWRLKHEYGVSCVYEEVPIVTARWIHAADSKKLALFREKVDDNLALDGSGCLAYLAPSRVNLNLVMERWPDLEFKTTREHVA